ncbi:hypothetical protein BOTBODRAFT_26022 [Botryobasidium botryosum FD-172 SS1]|uniref:HAD-like protein n=1 Tax=Botryobasidium botryosum (strain FD-172 SS1) TaxID=930990 RepID=A0A067NCR0_BOTB1|nr:hypothetical protein BOTBODRAFT_26022 [Botryobasidium botryosum FD-172 SS1]
MATKSRVEYVLFDMDGLLINTEHIYTVVTNTILARYGKKMTWDIKAGCMGKPERQASEYLLSFFPDIDLTVDQYIVERRELQDASWPTVSPLPGAEKLVRHLHAHGIPIAVATGSQHRNFVLKTSHLSSLFDLFGGNVVCGDDERILPGRGKPNPDVFLVAAKTLGRNVGEGDVDQASTEEKIERRKGLVFEDAISGVVAGMCAGMKVVWIPDPELTALYPPSEVVTSATLKTLEDFVPEEWGLPPYPSSNSA